jgi:adenine-specific DNA methylase
MTSTCKKLIEVAMPIKEISAESVRDKSIRHGHISTLHLWWARRPLPVCRAVVFASLVPDPLDENCPPQFREAVELILGKSNNPGDPYRPYEDIPYTAAIDKMDDNPRNRLLMFIGKFSDKYTRMGEKTPAKDMLTDSSLIKWDSKNNEAIINKARKLIWVSHNSASIGTQQSAQQLLDDFDTYYSAIKSAENELYSLPNRHISTPQSKVLESNLQNAIDAFLDKMPKVFDPFAGGGAIPLEAARLGCRSFGNDINPVAHIIQKGSLEFPQKYGKPITYSKEEFLKLYSEYELTKVPYEWKVFTGNSQWTAVTIPNRLSFDVEYYANVLLKKAEKEVQHLYPADDKGNRPLVYYWARVARCSNPACKAEIPLLKQFYLSKRRSATENQYIYLNPIIEGKNIEFEIKKGKCDIDGWNQRTNITCPVCGNVTDTKTLKSEFIRNQSSVRLLAVIEEDANFKRDFRLPNHKEIEIVKTIQNVDVPQDSMQVGNNRNFNTPGWGISKFGEMFTSRQLVMLESLIKNLDSIKKSLEDSHDQEYLKSIYIYLGILVDRIAARNTSLGVWHILQETVEHPFGRQAIPMVFDFPEMYPFSSLSGGALGQLQSINNYILEESSIPISCQCLNASSGVKNQFSEKFLTAVITDPPYYDAIAYADLSDFFYLWLKKTIGDVFPMNFATPQTPKFEECTALKHHHSNDNELAKRHFEKKLLEIFNAIEHQTSDVVSIMFAHQSTEAWTTLCNSILGSGMNITGSWANDTEVTNALKNEMAVLSSSVTVSCRPSQRQGYGNYREIKKAIEVTVDKEVKELYALGFRGADLLTACFGQAASEFGRFEKVEKADGNEVTIAELLGMARESAFNALLKGFDGDDFTKFYIGWLQLYGFVESDFDDAAKFAKVGLSINVSELFTEYILIKKGNKQTLGTFEQRKEAKPHLGEKADSFLIDQVHRAMALYKGTNRNELLQYIGQKASSPESSFWRVVTSLCEILPSGCDDHKQATGLHANKESLIRESKSIQRPELTQTKLFE